MAQNILPDTGSVGVGTISPISLFHAKGNVELTSGHGVGNMTVGDNTSTFFQVAGSQRGTDTTNQFQGGFGFLSGSSQVSPIIWMYGHAIRNAFQIRSKGYNGKVQDAPVLFHVGGNQKVGIGTDSPNYKLDVLGDIAMGSSLHNSEAKFIIKGPNTPVGFNSKRDISFEFSSAGKSQIRAYRGGSWDTYLQFLTTPNTGGEPVERLHINGNGNIGIGTLNPTTKLQVNGDFSIVGEVGSLIADKSGARLKFIRPSSNYISASDPNGFLSFGAGGIEQQVVLRENGSLGIATASPQTKLHVNGSTRVNEELQLGNDYGRVYYDASTVGEPNRGLIFQEKLSNQRGFHFLNSSGGELLRILGNGSVGIGTTTIPSDFKLAVSGKILTEKVVVRKEENWNWPDFVFHKNYQLPELSDVEAFINANNHLPEIPSAKEIEANGQDLAEMNRLLLKKVEELTLYIIQIQKTQEALIEKIQEQ